MRISNRTIYAVVGVLALLTISTQLQSNTRPTVADDISVAPQAEPPVTRYVETRGSSSTSRRAATEVAEKAPAVRLPKTSSVTSDEESGARAQVLVDDEPVVDVPAPEPALNPGGMGFDESGQIAQSAPAQPGTLSDQGVYELFVSNLDEENKRSFRATWALMTPEERQEWLQGARSALSN
ncbi:hypothetical protein EON81_16170 [bacterium]|nr:MAG: hypothetical protein EON81_16170 [bacterium]